MALDKQQILNELGSVMNKLKSADCGCMGNIFSKGQYSNQAGQGGATMSSLPTCGGCRRGCCRGHGYGGCGNGYSAGEPCANSYTGVQCTPKLYADTYNYLNSNLMQPIVNEVYQDLKSLNETNTIANNPMANNILNQQQGEGAAMQGMSAQSKMPGSVTGGMQNPNMANQQIANQQISNQNMGGQQAGQVMGGMGPNIVGMMNSSVSGKTATVQSKGHPSGDMNEGMNMNNGTLYGGQQGQSQYMQNQSMSNAIIPNNTNTMGGNMQHNNGQATPSYKVNYSNPAAQQMASHRSEQKYGQHTPGMSKFNEMFPGVIGGDLGFDPMAIAIQMNPANQQQAAMGAMQKVMEGNPIGHRMNTKVMQPAITGANAAAVAAYDQSPQIQQINPSSDLQPAQPEAVTQQCSQKNSNVVDNKVQRQVYFPQQQQQTYTALTGAPTLNQNQPPQQYQQPATQQYQQQLTQQNQQQPTHLIQQEPAQQYQPIQQYQQIPTQQYQQQPTQQYKQPPSQQYHQKQHLDPLEAQSIVAPNLPTTYGRQMSESNVLPQSYNAPPSTGQTIKDPIFPVDCSRYQPPSYLKHQRAYEYNTLGQPVELLPAKMYHTPPPTGQQQTLSPQPVPTNQPRFAVKNTVSKTSLMGSKPVGRAPSRGQLQQIYNQYKGSQSYTQQNIRPAHGPTYSEGKINVTSANEGQNRHVPVERVGGDTLANNQMVQQVPGSQPLGHSGDVPMPVDNKPHGDMVPTPTKEFPDKRCRNGLQDVVHTSFHPSKGPSWSFHGNNIRSAPMYRGRA